MTEQQMAKKIVECVKQRPGATFIEIIAACGPDATDTDDHVMTMGEGGNIILWRGTSDLFVKAFALAKPNLEPCVQPQQLVLMNYLFDGTSIPAPLLDEEYLQEHGTDIQEERWLPMVFNWRKAK